MHWLWTCGHRLRSMIVAQIADKNVSLKSMWINIVIPMNVLSHVSIAVVE